MLVSPSKRIKKLRYVVWDLTGTIDAMPVKLKKLDVEKRMHWVWRSKDIFTEGLTLSNHQKKEFKKIAHGARKSFERNDDVNPLHFITYMGSIALHEKILDLNERNKRLKKLFAEIADSLGLVEEGYNEHVAEFIISTRDCLTHYLVTNLPKEPAKIVLSRMGLLGAFERIFFYVIKSKQTFIRILKQIIKNRNKEHFLVIGDEYFKEIEIAHNAGVPTAWINTGRIKKEHYFHPELVADSPDELVSYIGENYL
jgi:FMN phosphatase YigB (HAD superfamily)